MLAPPARHGFRDDDGRNPLQARVAPGARGSAAELARRLGLHANTVRSHLGVLADAGVVRSHTAPRAGPAAVVYELARDGRDGGPEDYRLSRARAGGEIRMDGCPFRELAESHGGVLCGIHRGVIDGALADLGAEERVVALEPFAGPSLCTARVAVRA